MTRLGLAATINDAAPGAASPAFPGPLAMHSTYEACPACGGAVHRIAGRCKHCKVDLAQWRAARIQRPPVGEAGEAGAGGSQGRAGAAALAGGLTTPPETWIAVPPAVHAGWWRRRWPLVAIAVAVIAIAVSVVVLLRGDADARDRRDGRVRASGRVPESPNGRFGMPNVEPNGPGSDPWRTTPQPPGPPSDPGDDPADEPPTAPDPFDDQADLDDLLGDLDSFNRNDPWAPPPPRGLTSPPGNSPDPSGAPPPHRFTASLGTAVCERLSSCGLLDPAMQASCSTVAAMLSEPDIARRITAGECSYNPSAAATCLRIIASLPCDGQSGDMLDTMSQLSGLTDCASALVCVDPWDP